jgi:hypothetical protein
MRQVMKSKRYRKIGTGALASQIRFAGKEEGRGLKELDDFHRKASGYIADKVIAKTGRLELGEKLRAKAKKEKKAQRLRTVKQALTGRAEQKS